MKEKLKFIPVNLFLSVPTFILVYFILNSVSNISNIWSILITFYIYLQDTISNSKLDYLEYEINKLKNSIL